MKKAIATVCSVLMIASVFSGCSSKSTSSGSTSATSSAAAKTTITIMQSKTEIQTSMQKVVDDYNSSQNNVTVKLLGTSGDNYPTVLQTQFSSTPAKAPTIFTISGPDAAKFNSFMAPLDSSKAASLLISSFKDEMTVDGKLVGLPMAVEGFGLIYNKDMFTKAGVDATSITSVDALTSACAKLQKVSGVTHAIAFAKDSYFIFIHPWNYAFATSTDYANQIKQVDAGTISLSGIPTVAQFAKDLDKIKTYTNNGLDSYDDQVSGFASGKFAMIHQGDWVQSMLTQDKISFNYGIMPIPTSNNAKLSVGLANAWRVNKYATADQQKAAINFLDWLITSDKGQSYNADTFGFISAFKGMKAPSTELAKDVSSYVQKNETIPWVYNTDFPNGIDADGQVLMQKYYANVINSDELLKELTAKWVADAKK
jgi:raffinose/stachyose/melibiose transport system substrate-binding protein